jgi:hypothetical protein
MSKCPRVDRFKPDFMAPSPRLLKDIDRKLTLEDDGMKKSDDEDNPENVFHPDKRAKRTKFYESSKVLGKLYRAINEEEFLDELQKAPVQDQRGVSVMQKLWRYIEKHTRGIQWKHLCEWARELKNEYEELVYDMQSSYGTRHHPLTEVEVFTGSILGNEDGSLPTRRTKENAKSMRDVF